MEEKESAMIQVANTLHYDAEGLTVLVNSYRSKCCKWAAQNTLRDMTGLGQEMGRE